LYAYEAPQSKRSFTYLRFGKTVILSLRTNERDYLRRIIDWRLEPRTDTLYDTKDFQRALTAPAYRQGLLAIARPDALWNDLAARPELNLRDWLRDPKRVPIRNWLTAYSCLEAAVTVNERIEIRLVGQNPATTSSLSPAASGKPLSLLNTVPANCIAFATFRYDQLAQTLAKTLNINQAFSEEAADPKALDDAVERLSEQWGLNVNTELAPALGKETAIVVHEVQMPIIIAASILLPVTDRVRAQAAIDRQIKTAAAKYADPARAKEIPAGFRETPDFHPLYPTPLGFLGVGWVGGYCMWGTSPNSYVAMRRMIENNGESIVRNPVFKSLELPAGELVDAVAFVNLEEVGRRAEGLLAVFSLLNKSVRKNAGLYGKMIAVLKLLRGVGLSATHSNEDQTILLRIPTQ